MFFNSILFISKRYPIKTYRVQEYKLVKIFDVEYKKNLGKFSEVNQRLSWWVVILYCIHRNNRWLKGVTNFQKTQLNIPNGSYPKIVYFFSATKLNIIMRKITISHFIMKFSRCRWLLLVSTKKKQNWTKRLWYVSLNIPQSSMHFSRIARNCYCQCKFPISQLSLEFIALKRTIDFELFTRDTTMSLRASLSRTEIKRHSFIIPDRELLRISIANDSKRNS